MKIAKVEDHYTIDEINRLLKQYKKNVEVHNRLLFIKALLNGHTITEITSIFDVSRQTGSRWLKNYNEYGLEGLVSNRHNSGSKCKLSNEQLRILDEEISNPNKAYTIKQAQKFILEEFGIEYSQKQVWVILRKKLGFNYGKPFLKFKEKPENCEEELKKTSKIRERISLWPNLFGFYGSKLF